MWSESFVAYSCLTVMDYRLQITILIFAMDTTFSKYISLVIIQYHPYFRLWNHGSMSSNPYNNSGKTKKYMSSIWALSNFEAVWHNASHEHHRNKHNEIPCTVSTCSHTVRRCTVVGHDTTGDNNTSADNTGIGFRCWGRTSGRPWITCWVVIRTAVAALAVFAETGSVSDCMWNVTLVKGTREELRR